MPLTTIYDGGTRVIGSESQPLFPQPLHPDVSAYLNRLVVAGYSPTNKEVNAVNNLILKMVANGIYAKCDLIYPILGTSMATAGFDLKNAFNATFLGSWTIAPTGMKSATANAANRATTGWNPAVHGNGANDHVAVYVREEISTVGGILGCYDGTNYFQVYARGGGTVGNTLVNNTLGGNMVPTGLSSARGLWVGTRVANNDSRLFVNAVQRASTTNTSVTRPNVVVTLACISLNGTSFPFAVSQEMAFLSIGDGLTISESIEYYNIVQAYQTELGRQV